MTEGARGRDVVIEEPHDNARTKRQSLSPRRSLNLSQPRGSLSSQTEGQRQSYAEVGPGIDDTNALGSSAHPRSWHAPAAQTLSKQLYRQILGFNPFKTSFLGLYRPLDTLVDRLIAVLGVVLAAAAGVPLPIIGVIFGQIIGSFPPSEDEMETRVGQLLGVAVAYFVVTAGYTTCFGLSGEKISIRVRQRLLDCLLHLDQSYYDTHDVDVTGLLTGKIETIQAGTSEKVGIFIQSISYFVAAFVVGFILNAKLTGILFAGVIPSMILVVAIGSTTVSKLSRKASDESQSTSSLAESAIKAVKVVQAYNVISKISELHRARLQLSARTSIRKDLVSAMMLGCVFFIAYAANALAFYVGSEMSAESGGGNAGTVYAVVFLILDASFVVGNFAPFLEIFARATSAGEEINDLFEVRRKADEARSNRKQLEDVEVRGSDITFENVDFGYPARPTVQVLKNFNLKLESGTFTSVVGTSGGGKSTLVSLLMQVYDSYSGHVKVGDVELRDIKSSTLRSQIAVLEQDCVLFSGTIYDNIRHGILDTSLSDEEVSARCEQAVKDAAVDFLPQLPQGIHTPIGSSMQLSGGQRQRICLARALVKNPALLILDEPTSALDAKSELLVAELVKRISERGTTVVMIAHRLSTVMAADRVVVVSDGQVVEQGAPRQLAEDGEVFKGLLKAQQTEATGQRSPSSADMLGKDSSPLESDSDDSLDTKAAPSDDETEEADSADTSAPQGFRQVAPKLFKLVKPDWPLICLGLVASIVTGLIIVGEAIVFGNLIELLNEGATDPDFRSRANFFCLMFFVLSLVALTCYTTSGSAFGIASTRLTGRVKMQSLTTILRQDLAWFSHEDRSVHSLMAVMANDATNLACLSGVALGTIFTVIVSMCGGIILAHIVAWRIAVVLLSAVPVVLLSGYSRLKILQMSEARHTTAYSRAASLASEACRSIRTVVILGREQGVLDEYKASLKEPYKKGLRFTVISNVLLAFAFAITYFVYALAYWWGAKNVREGWYGQKEFFIVLPALLFSAQGAGQLFSLSPEITRAKSAAKSILKLLDSEPTILSTNGSGPDHDPAAEKAPTTPSSSTPTTTCLEFKDVVFGYSAKDSQPALRGVSFTVENGQTVALVGPSGAGKSSTIGLMERYYDVTSGSILLNNTDIRSQDVTTVRSRLSLVSQDPELFPGTLSYNIGLGATANQQVSDTDIQQACRQCGLHDFIISLPSGYETDISSNAGAAKLSGGQQQRVALARALVRNPEILLLDEPTSAMDAHSEKHVQEALEAAAEGRTTVIVAHRLASIKHADKILVFDQGKIVEQGSHGELVAKGGLYASMAKAQSLA
ncbi:hypothetical protein MBLNU230_g1994t1 [Neophaeotheca triangularis]